MHAERPGHRDMLGQFIEVSETAAVATSTAGRGLH
jgi:hypothetical protein